VTGLAAADSPVSSVSLKDSATPQTLLTTTPDANGGFSFNVAGLAAPFMLKADAPSGAVYAIASQSGPANVNAITTVAVAAASPTHEAENSWSGHDSHSSHDIGSVIRSLGTVLKPLFDRYGITRIGEDDEGSHLRALLHDVSFTVKSGVITVANRATGGIIFTGPLSNLASGTFHAENMPAGPGGTPPPSCTHAYNAWGCCQSDGTQTRTVASATPVGCTGTPVLSQSCTYVPPVTCTLATAVPSCSACHAVPPASHTGRSLTCATCHGPVNNGTGTPSTGMTAALSGTTCRINYPTSGTHKDGVVNFGEAQ
jgi:hypothetical protein